MNLISYLRAFSRWVNVADWRSWLVHGVVGALIALAVGVLPVVIYFTLREAEQLAHELMSPVANASPRWRDHALDIIAPVLAAFLVTR